MTRYINVINRYDGLELSLKPSNLKIELDNDHIAVCAADNIVLFAGFELPSETHGEYVEWAEWVGWRFATAEDAKLFQSTIQSFVEREAGSEHEALPYLEGST